MGINAAEGYPSFWESSRSSNMSGGISQTTGRKAGALRVRGAFGPARISGHTGISLRQLEGLLTERGSR